MGAVIAFPADGASRRGAAGNRSLDQVMGTVVILPVIRIDRMTDETHGGSDPEQGTAVRRRRRRRARS